MDRTEHPTPELAAILERIVRLWLVDHEWGRRARTTPALAARFGREDWANPLRVWTLLGGSLLMAGVNGSHRPAHEMPLLLSLCRDWLGQPNALVPVAVDVQLWNDAVLAPDWLPACVRLLFRDLEGHSATRLPAEAEPSQVAGCQATSGNQPPAT